MASVHWDPIPFHQPLIKASLPHKGVHEREAVDSGGPLTVGDGKPPGALRSCSEWGALWGDEPLEFKFIDLTATPLSQHLSPFRVSTPDLKATGADIEGTVCVCCQISSQ